MQYTYKRLSILAAALLVAVTVFAVVIVANKSADPKEPKLYVTYSIPIEKIPVIKSQINLTEDILSIATAKSIYVQDITTQTVLFQKNADRILLPASTTKLMTALVALESRELDSPILISAVPQFDITTSILGIGNQYSFIDMLHAMLIQSNNEAAYAVAASHPGGISLFVERMNQKAQELGLESTYFENPVGFDAPRQISSARDLAVLTQVFLKEPILKNIVALSKATITSINSGKQVDLQTTHQLLGKDPTVIGVKTGTTQGANQVLITVFEREGRQILVIVMGSEDRYSETTQLADWAYASYELVSYQDLLARFTQTE